jgi:hypothetical protein
MTQSSYWVALSDIRDKFRCKIKGAIPRLHFYFFHKAFHIGLFEVLRHLAGKTDKLI